MRSVSKLILYINYALLLSCSQITPHDYYTISTNQVIYHSPWGNRVVEGANVHSFSYIGGIFGADNNHVYFVADIVEGANPNNFHAIDHTTGRDEHYIYRGTDKCDECDYSTFKRLSSDWYTDKYAAYSSSGNSWQRIDNVEVNSFTPLNDWFAKDSKRAYLNDKVILGVDVETFKLRPKGGCVVCAEDKNKCYAYSIAVPCNDKPPEFFEFNIKERPEHNNKARLDLTEFHHNRLGNSYITYIDDIPNDKVAELYLKPGQRKLNFSCESNDKTTSYGEIIVSVKKDRFYRLRITDFEHCVAQLFPVTWIKGKQLDPQISIQLKNDNSSRIYMEKALYGTQVELIIRCREVGRNRVRQDVITRKLNLIKGHVYQISGHFNDGSETCNINIVDQIANKSLKQDK